MVKWSHYLSKGLAEMQKRWLFIVIIMLIVTALIGVTLILAPDSTSMNILNTTTNSLSCLQNSEDSCLVMPSVSGLTSDSEAVNFPEQFEADYHLVVMPFDREQQVLAVTWLPLFQELASTHDNVQYWSIAALPELNSAIRFLVLTGISAGISDEDVRQQVTVLFLEQQAEFLDALAIDNDESIQAFIMDSDGVIYYRAIGEFTTERGENFREALDSLLSG